VTRVRESVLVLFSRGGVWRSVGNLWCCTVGTLVWGGVRLLGCLWGIKRVGREEGGQNLAGGGGEKGGVLVWGWVGVPGRTQGGNKGRRKGKKGIQESKGGAKKLWRGPRGCGGERLCGSVEDKKGRKKNGGGGEQVVVKYVSCGEFGVVGVLVPNVEKVGGVGRTVRVWLKRCVKFEEKDR